MISSLFSAAGENFEKFGGTSSQTSSIFSAAGENFENFGRLNARFLPFLKPQAKILRKGKKGQKCGNVEKGEKKGRGGQKRGKTP